MGITRRNFIKGGLGLYASLTVGELSSLANQAVASPTTGRTLVVVQLAGGNDGLNMVVPFTDKAYYRARPNIGIKESAVIPLNQNIGLNDYMPELAALYKKQRLAVIQGVGYPEQSRSHFRSSEIWQIAEPSKIIETGWLGRYLDLHCGYDKFTQSDNFFPAINADSTLPKALVSKKIVVSSLDTISDSKCTVESQAVYPADEFGQGMKSIAKMIISGVDCKIYNITLEGFDTHNGDGLNHNQLLRTLSQSFGAFQKDLETHQRDHEVVVMTYSEFGRRLAENDREGLDHGTAAPMLVLGSGINGGVIGDHPSLTALEDGDLKYAIDFRSVYASVLEQWLNADSKQILGNRFDQLDLFQRA